MALHAIDRILPAHIAAEELAIGREERSTGSPFQYPAAKRFGDADLRLEGPAVGADVDELVGIVLTCGRGDRHADAYDRVLPIVRELLDGQRGRPIDVGGEAHRQVRETRPPYAPLVAADLTARREPRVRQQDRRRSGIAEDVE